MLEFDQPLPRSIEDAIRNIQDAPSLRSIKAMLDKVEMSADMKALLYDIAGVTVRVADAVVAIGRRILEIVMNIFKKFPNTALGVIAALTLTAIIASIPVFGAVLAATLKSLLVLLGLTAGAVQDIRQTAFKDAMDRVSAEFAPFKDTVLQ